MALYSVLGFVWLVCLRADVISGELMTMGKGAAAGEHMWWRGEGTGPDAISANPLCVNARVRQRVLAVAHTSYSLLL